MKQTVRLTLNPASSKKHSEDCLFSRLEFIRWGQGTTQHNLIVAEPDGEQQYCCTGISDVPSDTQLPFLLPPPIPLKGRS